MEHFERVQSARGRNDINGIVMRFLYKYNIMTTTEFHRIIDTRTMMMFLIIIIIIIHSQSVSKGKVDIFITIKYVL